MEIELSAQLSAEYVKRRPGLLVAIRRRVGPSDAEDVLHEVWLARIAEPTREVSYGLLVVQKCGQWLSDRRRVLLGLPDGLAARSQSPEDIERAHIASEVLDREEVESLLRDWGNQRPAGKFARRIRLARAKARREL